MKHLYPIRIRRLVDRLLRHRRGDHTPAALRQAVEARAAILSGGERLDAPEVPAELAGYVDAVAREAYKVTDRHVAELRAAGYGDDAIFEITLSAVVGPGLARFERGLAVLAEATADEPAIERPTEGEP